MLKLCDIRNFINLIRIIQIIALDIIYAYHPPLTVGLAAIILKKFFNVPLVYDIQDMWPDSLEATGMVNSKKLQKIASFFCDLVYSIRQNLVLSPDLNLY